MAISDDLRKTFSDPTPLYFAAGTADLALQQARKVPGMVEQLRAEAPARFEAVRRTDTREFQDRAAARAKDVQETIQTAVTGLVGQLDTDIRKLGESAQGLALRGVGVAVEYAVKARETYEKVAEHGEQAVKTWRGEGPAEQDRAVGSGTGAGASAPASGKPGPAADKPGPVAVKDEAAGQGRTATAAKAPASASSSSSSSSASSSSASAGRTAAKKTAARRNGTKKTTPPAK
ncbi:hypothetical protein GCM10018793_56150 [Streptomyces sulfonofaciens]|uniref:Heparin binding hemagglutinin HbhA n=1 Tax=Streptomyces sulfonofaciens TaxID=68272 RepID=A0A919GL53_9ACTN|nr:hypothetical protein [Streptomyces sulfonofaciens]GHH85981.1 hypothetical protein GCM10018793_56150 [Streptomyces sulfonofaciens]